MTFTTEFKLTDDHLKLMKRMFIEWDDTAYDGAPAVNIKRPYGNSDVPNDVAEIVSGREDDDTPDSPFHYGRDGDLRSVEAEDGRVLTVEDLTAIHKEMATALQIVLCTGAFRTGLYRTTRMYDSLSWERVGDL